VKRRVLILSVLTLAAVAAAAVVHERTSRPTIRKEGTRYRVVSRGYSYTFDAAWRVESVRSPDGALNSADVERTEELRGVLLKHLGLDSIDKVPVEGEAELRALKELGYI
jgi:hypothetical protein